ncbi:MAG: hypothetical protein COS68_04505 [Elusimicrobia bacterium CG06_land_8_20_14_3_00_38_11]|nr:MAG: hypothetical protein COS68_04505 [Elusimicrobia bacterium CG06_land_8_20_14_3_00_38_11]
MVNAFDGTVKINMKRVDENVEFFSVLQWLMNYKGATGVHRNNTEKTSVNFCDIQWLNLTLCL